MLAGCGQAGIPRRVLLRQVLLWRVVSALGVRAAGWFRAAELFLQPGGACASMHRCRSLFRWQGTKDALPSGLGALMPSQPFLHPQRDGAARQTCPRRGKQSARQRVGTLLVLRRKMLLRFEGTLFVALRLLSQFCGGPAVSRLSVEGAGDQVTSPVSVCAILGGT